MESGAPAAKLHIGCISPRPVSPGFGAQTPLSGCFALLAHFPAHVRFRRRGVCLRAHRAVFVASAKFPTAFDRYSCTSFARKRKTMAAFAKRYRASFFSFLHIVFPDIHATQGAYALLSQVSAEFSAELAASALHRTKTKLAFADGACLI